MARMNSEGAKGREGARIGAKGRESKGRRAKGLRPVNKNAKNSGARSGKEAPPLRKKAFFKLQFDFKMLL